MKSVFLEGISTNEEALAGLRAEFPTQLDYTTKVVFSPDGKHAVGWLCIAKPDDVNDHLGPYIIQGDYSGRDWQFDAKAVVVKALRRVQARIGGELRDYGD